MSPLTAFGLLLSSFTLFRLVWIKDKKPDDSAGWSATAVLIIGIFLFLAYIYHSPMLYGTTVIPVAITTSIAFIFSASGLIASLSKESFPLRLFSGPSVYARLLRYFIPTILLSTILNVWLDSLIIEYIGVKVLLFAVSTIITLLLLFIIVLKISGMLSKEIDSYVNSLRSSEQKLAASQKLLQDIIDNSSSLIYALDSEGRFLLINRKFESLFGVSRETLIGKTREVILPPEIAALHRANDLRVIAERQAINFDENNDEPDGKHSYLSVKFPLLDLQVGEYGIGGISTDITERKKTEEALQRYSSELEKSNKMLQEALANIKTLSGMLPICASCKKIRDDKGYWNRIESYITNHSGVLFSHGICPDCEKKMYEELEKLKNGNT
ncbi:MAG: PAS domain S-box protein [Nitrospirae bacterium]|nr:PAS domain S-box protein [Nitrospirota bacterium]